MCVRQHHQLNVHKVHKYTPYNIVYNTCCVILKHANVEYYNTHISRTHICVHHSYAVLSLMWFCLIRSPDTSCNHIRILDILWIGRILVRGVRRACVSSEISDRLRQSIHAAMAHVPGQITESAHTLHSTTGRIGQACSKTHLDHIIYITRPWEHCTSSSSAWFRAPVCMVYSALLYISGYGCAKGISSPFQFW